MRTHTSRARMLTRPTAAAPRSTASLWWTGASNAVRVITNGNVDYWDWDTRSNIVGASAVLAEPRDACGSIRGACLLLHNLTERNPRYVSASPVHAK